MTEKDGKLYGRGSTDDKGPVLGWLHAISAYNATKTEIPINLKVRLLKYLRLLVSLFYYLYSIKYLFAYIFSIKYLTVGNSLV